MLRETGLSRTGPVVVFGQDDTDDATPAQTQDGEALMRLVANAQHLNATMVLVKILIATHHDARWLKRTWEANLTQQTDQLFDAPAPFGDDALKQVMLDAWRLTTQDYIQVIEEAVKQHFPDDE